LVGTGIALIGAILAIIGSIGLIRLPDFYTRVHAQTVAVVGGACLLLLGFAVHIHSLQYSLKILLIIIVILISSPTSSHAIAKAAKKSGIKFWRGK
jgi:multicomponent Na+:H+ antiporter subunit G